ncbi:MAG: hypothetical protein E4H14_00225 [Candidatus Thorarchaeota archaeon]|nr:MAG: hypothetical protein E4H14_00225 [Candidatus Thorarchaeota archaeon]
MSLIRGTYLYYQGLLFGTGFIGVYFWIIITAPMADRMMQFIFFLSALVVAASVYALARAKTRSNRTSLTVISGLVGGAHAYMTITLWPDWFFGMFLFIWFFLGMLLAAAALHWLPETDFETTAE